MLQYSLSPQFRSPFCPTLGSSPISTLWYFWDLVDHGVSSLRCVELGASWAVETLRAFQTARYASAQAFWGLWAQVEGSELVGHWLQGWAHVSCWDGLNFMAMLDLQSLWTALIAGLQDASVILLRNVIKKPERRSPCRTGAVQKLTLRHFTPSLSKALAKFDCESSAGHLYPEIFPNHTNSAFEHGELKNLGRSSSSSCCYPEPAFPPPPPSSPRGCEEGQGRS